MRQYALIYPLKTGDFNDKFYTAMLIIHTVTEKHFFLILKQMLQNY